MHIREVVGGGVCLAGAIEKEVTTKQEMANILEQGSLLRATAATGMNKRSSRSHAIFTITVEQRRQIQSRRVSQDGATPKDKEDSKEKEDSGEDSSDDEEEELVEDYLCAKMHLVDLAGSERVCSVP